MYECQMCEDKCARTNVRTCRCKGIKEQKIKPRLRKEGNNNKKYRYSQRKREVTELKVVQKAAQKCK